MFSPRVPRDLSPNRLTRAVVRARAAGRVPIDLTTSNPTTAGIEYPARLLEPLSDPRGCSYAPHPRGLRAARDAVAADYARRGITVASDRIVLTASTSEAYSWLFKLLCAPGDGVMTPAPSYPLFDHLARLDGVETVPYRLEYHGRWAVDEASVEQGWSDRIRAVMAVSPNNPTGSVLSAGERAWLDRACATRDTALILDEVFADYPLDDGSPGGLRYECGAADALTFLLGGLSKSAGLPQAKLGWIAVVGPAGRVDEALERLEYVADTYLSVSTPVQIAAPDLIAAGAAVRARILDRVRSNYAHLEAAAAAHPAVSLLRADAGWSAVLRIPATRSEEDVVLDLLERDGVLVHPGFFFDFPHEAFIVLSLLPEPEVFDAGVAKVLERAGV
jgi:alanine-synthesizing transaminase